jgi:ABC-type phosphate transport system auxiliary subunit
MENVMTKINFSLFTNEELNKTIEKIKDKQIEVIKSNEIEWTRLYYLKEQIEKEINIRAKEMPMNERDIINLLNQ